MEPSNETLANSVELAVKKYLTTMEGQKITDLYELVLSEIEAPLLKCVMEYTNNNQSRTALVLGLNRGTLRQKLKKFGMI